MVNASHLTQLALDVWRSSGLRTIARLESLVTTYAESYFGSSAAWPIEVREFVAEATTRALAGVRSWEVR